VKTKADCVYHISDTIHLPWIIASGELRPGIIKDVGIGLSRFLWGTTNPRGDLTSRPQRRINWPEKFGGDYDPLLIHANQYAWQAGVFHMVRFTLVAEDFMSLDETVRSGVANWTPEEVAEMIELDQRLYGEFSHKRWRLRHDPLPLSRVLKVETTSYDDRETERWHPFDIGAKGVLLRPRDPRRKGVRIAGRAFYSVPVGPPDYMNFQAWVPPAKRAAARAAAALERRQDADFCRRLEQQERA
jgi:hypothetical protein